MPTAALPRGKTIEVLLKDEVTFGTPPSGNYTKTFIYSHTLELKKPFEKDALLGIPRTNNRDTTAPGPGLPDLGGEIVVPLDFNHIGLWLKGAFGAATVTGSGDPYTHVFKSGGEVLPHRTIEEKLAAAIFLQRTGLLVNTLQFDLGRKAGYDRMTVGLLGRDESKQTSSQGGTPTAPWAIEQAPAALGVFKLNGTIVATATSVKAKYDNKGKPLEYLGSAYPAGHDLDDEATFEGSMDLRFTDATLYDMAVANAGAVSGELLWQSSASRSLSILANAMRLERSSPKISGPGGITQSFNFKCEQSASAEMITATLKSLVPTY